MKLYGGSNHVPLHQVSGFYGKVMIQLTSLSILISSVSFTLGMADVYIAISACLHFCASSLRGQ